MNGRSDFSLSGGRGRSEFLQGEVVLLPEGILGLKMDIIFKNDKGSSVSLIMVLCL